jgi:hypothetical protein
MQNNCEVPYNERGLHCKQGYRIDPTSRVIEVMRQIPPKEVEYNEIKENEW